LDSNLLEHMMEPKNYGVIEDSDAQGIGKNPSNGEKVIIFLKVTNENEPIIADIKFQAIGCMTTVVTGSIITSEAMGLTLKRAEDLVGATLGLFDNIPPEEAACSEMVALALQASIDTYRHKQEDSEFPMVTYKISNSCTPKQEATDE